MSLALLCGAGLVFGLVVLWVTLRHDGIDRSFCPLIHRVGPVILTHYNSVECFQAVGIANMAWKLWVDLGDDFPSETKDPLFLRVILDPKRKLGWKPFGTSIAVVNLAHRLPKSPTHPDFERRLTSIRSTMAEEVHHVARFRRSGDAEYTYINDPEEGHLGVVLYYALNPHETEALRFVVEATGDRADLLGEVEECLKRRGES